MVFLHRYAKILQLFDEHRRAFTILQQPYLMFGASQCDIQQAAFFSIRKILRLRQQHLFNTDSRATAGNRHALHANRR